MARCQLSPWIGLELHNGYARINAVQYPTKWPSHPAARAKFVLMPDSIDVRHAEILPFIVFDLLPNDF
jgi:hypothetical protein